VSLRMTAFGDIGCAMGATARSPLVEAVQRKLTALSDVLDDTDPRKPLLNPGGVDGILGPNTRRAIKGLQHLYQQPETGEITAWVRQMLGIDPQLTNAPAPSPTRVTPPPSSGGAPPQPASSGMGFVGWALLAVGVGAVGRALTRRKRREG